MSRPPPRLISPVLLRAPLLPTAALAHAPRALLRHPLGPDALALASPELGAALAGKARDKAQVDRSVARYALRAAFRPTPSGLLAGVMVGQLGARTQLETTGASGSLAPSWAALAALGRTLLDTPALLPQVRLRRAPSVLVGGGEVTWLALTADGLDPRAVALDEPLAEALDACADWTPWPDVRAALAALEDDARDDLLATLVDEGLLCHDLAPPLVGEPPLRWMIDRLRGLARTIGEAAPEIEATAAALATAFAPGAPVNVAAARAALSPDLRGTLVIETRGGATLARAAVERAAGLAPLLFRLQEALAAPAAERSLDAGLLARLATVAELQGAGALSVAALATGGYGVALDEGADDPASPVPPALLGHLVDALTAAAGAGAVSLTLDPAVLEPLLPDQAPPPTYELFVTPAREPARAAPGTDWLLGLHAPAGASLGRFAHALGAPLGEALAALAAAEQDARPGEQALDVVQAASTALADLGVHPPVRAAALALVSWPAGAAVTAADLELVVDEAADEPLALRTRTGHPVAPAPLHRVRSTTVPPGMHRLLAGWSFARQHAPWAFSWGPLATLAFLPRVIVEGFVIAPASWRLPARETLADARARRAWRKASGVPRVIQVGEGDELLPIDLDQADAVDDLVRHAGGRAWEIWPPLDRLPDRGGRRVEAVVAVVDVPDDGEAARRQAAIAATAAAGRVPPPADAPPADGWRTFRIFGGADHQDALLHEVIAPLVTAAHAEGQIDAWFFVRYVDRTDGRAHLRLRAHAPGARGLDSFARRLDRAFSEAWQRGAVVSLETAPYFRETARYQGPVTMAAVERLFEVGSDLVLAALALEDQGLLPHDGDRRLLAARTADALARGLGLDDAERRALAERRVHAWSFAVDDDGALRAELRRVNRSLQDALAGQADPFSAPLTSYEAAVTEIAAALAPPDRVRLRETLAPLLHMQATRLLGPDAAAEHASYFFWARAREALAARARRPERRG